LPPVKEPRHAERQQRQPDPGRDGQADRRPADRFAVASPVVLHIRQYFYVE